MKVGAIQSCYLPWRGYFDFIDSVDLFVLYDDVQYSRGSWRNRNRIKTPAGVRWMTVPVCHRFGERIDEVRIASDSGRWKREHRRLIELSLGEAPHFADALRIWEEGTAQPTEFLTELNEALIRRACEYLGVRTPLRRSSEFALSGTRTDRLISLLRAVRADVYVSGPSARAYLDEAKLLAAGFGLEYKRYVYPEYPQRWGPFEGAVTILDLIANCGPDSTRYLRSLEPNEVVRP